MVWKRFATRPRLSLRMRLTLWVVVIFTVIQWSSGVVFWLYQSASLNRLFDEQLGLRARDVAGVIQPWLPNIEGKQLDEIASSEMRLFQFDRSFVEVFRPDGTSLVEGRARSIQGNRKRVALAAAQALPVIAHVPMDRAGEGGGTQVDMRAAFVGLKVEGRGDYVVAVATSDAFVRRQLALLGRVLMLTALMGPLAAAIAGWFIGGIAVEPFKRLGAIARGMGPESVGQAVKVATESSEVMRLAKELDLARQRMMEGFAAQERFLSNVSHEIKTPIAVMLIEAQTLDLTGSSERVRGFVESTAEEMLRLGRLVESFLTLTRVRDGKGIARITTYTVNDLIIDSAEHCAAMAGQYRVRLVPGLLADDETIDTAVAGEPELLRTMLDNLVRNAIRFSPPEDRVEISATFEDGVVSLRVRDSGPGIPEARLRTIFDRFAQAPEEQRQGRGHGLGLAIAQGIAELHGGSIRVENCANRGCVFIVELPAYSGASNSGRA